MGINMRWEDERGEVMAELLDPDSFLARWLSKSPADSVCLRFIDRYGDTVFNQLQIPFLISELESALPECKDENQQRAEAIIDFVRQATSNVHTYIKFYGD